MRQDMDELLHKYFRAPEHEGVSKVADLGEAIRLHVKPNMHLHFPLTNLRGPTAIGFELARVFWNEKPEFTISSLAVNFPLHLLIYRGLVKKIATGAMGDPYLSPRPNRIFQKALKENQVELEAWSLLTLVQQWKAGAMGLPFAPTNSLLGTNMETDLTQSGSVSTIEDPFGSGRKVALVRAVNPDIALVHGWVSDKYGNTIFLPPWGDSLYGALASKNGVIVTVEKIVPTDVIRQYAHLVKIPGYMVRSVTEVPFGAHPSGMSSYGMPGFEGYIEDYEFFQEFNGVCKDDEKLNQWVTEWVLDGKTHWDYLKKVGYPRLEKLKGESFGDSWKYKVACYTDHVNGTAPCSPEERAAVGMSRVLRQSVVEHNYHALLGGAGQSLPAAFLAVNSLKSTGCEVDLLIEMGMFGMVPMPANPFLMSPVHFWSSKLMSDSETMLGILVGGATNCAIAALAVAEIDKFGNINSTKIVPKNIPLIGSGGANDICSTAHEVVAVTGAQGVDRLVAKVSYLTSPGKNVSTLVTDLGIFRKPDGQSELVLVAYHPLLATESENIANIKQRCGWDLKIADNLEVIDPATAEELQLLRLIDAPGVYFGTR